MPSTALSSDAAIVTGDLSGIKRASATGCSNAKTMEAKASDYSMKRNAEPQGIAEVGVFLATDRASFATRHLSAIDGAFGAA